MTPRLSSSVPVPTTPTAAKGCPSKPRAHHARASRSLDDHGHAHMESDPLCPMSNAHGSGTRRKSVSFDLAHNSERTLPRDSGKSWKRLEKQIADLGLSTPATRAFADYYVCERHGQPEVVVKSPPKEVALKYMMQVASSRAAGLPKKVARQDSGLAEGLSLASVRGSRPVVGCHHKDDGDRDSGSDMDADYDNADDNGDMLPRIDESDHEEVFAMDDADSASGSDDASSIDSGYPASSSSMAVPIPDPEPELIDLTIRTLALSKTPDHPILHLPEDHNMFVNRKAVREMVQATEALARDLDDIEFGKKKGEKRSLRMYNPRPRSKRLPSRCRLKVVARSPRARPSAAVVRAR
ncbi:hypothetical protein BCR44DRAFT_1426559, partial [Catenaria anguillulae PL171]